MTLEVQKFVEGFKNKHLPILTIADFTNNKDGIKLSELLKSHNHEIWRKCKCGNEEDLRMTFDCSICGEILFKPSN